MIEGGKRVWENMTLLEVYSIAAARGQFVLFQGTENSSFTTDRQKNPATNKGVAQREQKHCHHPLAGLVCNGTSKQGVRQPW